MSIAHAFGSSSQTMSQKSKVSAPKMLRRHPDQIWKWPKRPSQPKPVVNQARVLMREWGESDGSYPALSEKTQEAVIEFLESAATERTTYPSVVPDENGIAILHWAAGPFTIQVDVEESGPTYIWMMDNESGSEPIVETDPSRVVELARSGLENMARRVMRSNPNWLEQYNSS